MLARAKPFTPHALLLLLSVTSLAIAIAACPKVPAPLTSSEVKTVEPEEAAEEGPQVAMDDDGGVGAVATCDGVNGVDELQKRADAFIATGDVNGGIACLEEAVASDPKDTKARALLVKRALQHDDAKARVYAEELVRQVPLDVDAREMLGRAYLQQRMWNEAIASFDLVVKQKPDDVWAHNNMGFAALQVNKLDVAREHLERVLDLSPQKGYMLNNLGVTYERLGRDAEAHAAYARACELAPKYVVAHVNRDRVQAKLTQDQRIVSNETLLRMRGGPDPTDAAVKLEGPNVGGGDEVAGDGLRP
jgi:Flp pilus assembly protein TadD